MVKGRNVGMWFSKYRLRGLVLEYKVVCHTLYKQTNKQNVYEDVWNQEFDDPIKSY